MPITIAPATTATASRTVPVVSTATPAPTTRRPDPLAVTLANGTSFSAVDRSSLSAELNTALRLGADVPGRVQDGPTCGLYALGMVMDFWDRKDKRNLNPSVRNEDIVRWDSQLVPPDTSRRLLDEAKQRGFTTQGEMFYADKLASLASAFGYKATVKSDFTLRDLHAVLDRGHPALVAFDVDNAGNPGLFHGKRAHWAVIEGHFKKDGVEYLVATHAWTGKEYVWKADDLMASTQNLKESDFVGAPSDLTGTLRNRLVEVTPGRQPSAMPG